MKAITELKNLNLLYQVYVPIEIFSVTGRVVIAMQNNCELISKTTTNVFEGKECDEEKIKEFINSVLTGIALSNTLIKNRLEVLTSNSPKDF